MESSVVVDDSRGDAVTNRKAVSDLQRKSSVISEGRVEKVEAPIDESGLLTVAEKLMLDFLLEKERNGRRKSVPSPSLVKEDPHRVPGSSRRFYFVTHRLSGRKETSEEDRSVIQTMDELTDDRLMRMVRECDEDGTEFGASGTETNVSGSLGYVTGSKCEGRTLDKSRRGIETETSRQKSISGASFGQSMKPSAPLPVQDDQGRIRSSFTQDTVEAPSTSMRNVDAEATAFATQPRSNRGFRRPRRGSVFDMVTTVVITILSIIHPIYARPARPAKVYSTGSKSHVVVGSVAFLAVVAIVLLLCSWWKKKEEPNADKPSEPGPRKGRKQKPKKGGDEEPAMKSVGPTFPERESKFAINRPGYVVLGGSDKKANDKKGGKKTSK